MDLPDRALAATAPRLHGCAAVASNVTAPASRSSLIEIGYLRRARGFTLFELTFVLLIVGLMTTFVLATARGLINSARHRDVQTKLATVDQALLTYVSANFRLPCPADGSLAIGSAGSGVEVRMASGDCGPTLATQEINGVVPWVTLGIAAADTTDPWLGQMTYRVASGGHMSLSRDNALKMTDCDPAGSAGVVTSGAGAGVIDTCAVRPAVCNLASYASCTTPAQFLLGRGLTVNDDLGAALMSPLAGTGAAYVLISHSENLFGGFGTDGGAVRAVLGAGPGPSETANTNGTPLKAVYLDPLQTQAPAAYFDDYVSRPSVASLILKAQLWARPSN